MSLFKTTSRENTIALRANTDSCLLNTNMCVLDTEEEVPLLSGILLAEKLLEMNRLNPDLDIYREKIRIKDINWSFLRDNVLYRDRLVVSAKEDLRTRIIEDLHARIFSAHPGRNKTRRLLY